MIYYFSATGNSWHVATRIAGATQGTHSNLSTIGFAIGFVLMMVLDVVLG